MKLSPKTELIVAAVLITYISFTNGFPIVRDVLKTGLGKALVLAAIVYVWKYVSAVVALLLAIAFVHCASWNVWEGLETPLTTCTCEAGFVYDASVGKCKNPEGASKDPVACTCPSGYTYDATKKECIPASTVTPPVAPPPEAMPTMEGAPAMSTGPVTSNAPMTTPGAAQAMAASAPPMTAPPAGPTPTTESFTSGYSQY
jgi:hypothetical protein